VRHFANTKSIIGKYDSRVTELHDMSGASGGGRDSARRILYALASLSALILLYSAGSSAAPVYQPPGANLTYGDVTHRQRVLSAAGNPAAAAADAARAAAEDTEQRGGVVFSVVAGLEFGNLDEFYDRIDAMADAIKPSPPVDGDPGEPPLVPPGGGINLGEIIDVCCPDLADLIDRVEEEIAIRAALLTLISVDAYGKAFGSVDVPIVLGKQFAGGTWAFGLNWSGSAKAYGVVDNEIRFNAVDALADLTDRYNLQPGDAETLFDIVGDVDIVIDPVLGRARAFLNNDSTLLTKASRTTELGFSYSRHAADIRGGSLFLGAEGKYYDLELSRIGVRFGDVTNSEDLFEIIRDSNFRHDSGFGFDVGALWVAGHYQLGASLTNVNQPSFEYQAIDVSSYVDPSVIDQLLRDQTYTMRRQLKLEASVFTPGRRWGFNVGIDANAVEDPIGDDFQWLTLSGGWNTSSRWLQNARFGYRHNLAGTELSYLGIGTTMFKWFNIDLAVEIDRVTIDEETRPRGALLSAGFQVNF
jgi:hypothetical protein